MANAQISRIVSDCETQLTGGISVGATSFTIQSVVDLDGNTLSDGIYCFTIDRDSTAAKEYLVGQLTNATKTVSSISSVGRQGTLTANAQRAHRIGANVIISDHSILSALSRIFSGVDTIPSDAPLAYTSAPTLSSATQLATKGYVDSVVTGGTVNSDRIIVGSQTAGETVAAGDIIYFKSSDSRWWKADADVVATFQNVQLGVAQGAGTAGNTITDGVLIYGKCDSFTGLTATATYYLSNTAGGVSTSAGTNSIVLGQAFATTGIFFNPSLVIPLFVTVSAGAADAGKGIGLNPSGHVDETMIPFDYMKTYIKKSGIASSATTGTTTVAHGLGVIPKYVKITINHFGTEYANNEYLFNLTGTFDGTTNNCIYGGASIIGGTGLGVAGTNTTYIYYAPNPQNSTDIRRAIATFDATNITFTWSVVGSNTIGPSFLWEAEGYTI